MNIVHIGVELAPLAKVGGLADVLYGLTQAFHQKGHSVEIILPKYDCLNLNPVENLEIVIHDLPSYYNGQWHHNSIWQGKLNGVTLTLIESHDPHAFFERQTIYGCPDDAARFLYFCRASIELLRNRPQLPTILHLHDWHTAPVSFLLKLDPHLSALNHARCILTIHNIAYQGICSPDELEKIGFSKNFMVPEKAFFQESYSLCNLLQAGIYKADAVTTVSPTYAKEVFTPDGGKGLEKALKENQDKFSGILNGIDYNYWDPETDQNLPSHFSEKSWKTPFDAPPFLEGKKKLQQHLRHILSLADEDCPIVSSVTRLVHQKAPYLLKQALLKTLEKGGQFILIGATSDKQTHEEFYNLKRKLASSRQVHIDLTYNESLSHLIYAASDLFLVPSLFEPCGLTQMIAMRYGTVPLVRETGGLMDTVQEGKNGFTFGPPTPEALTAAMDRALDCWQNDPSQWKKLMHAGMTQDFSWNNPAEEYLQLYEKISKPTLLRS